MGKVLITGAGGGGTSSDDCTATKAQVLTGYTAVTSDSDDESVTGTMANNGAINASLNCGASKSIPAGYTSGGTVTANSLASQTSADATAAYIYSGKTAWVNGSKLTGSMTCSSILSFSVAAYSTSQVLCTWQNPVNGPFSGVLICAKTGGYPSNQWDSRVYTGAGSNTAASGISSAIISSLTAGTTYYFRIWAYTNCSAGDFYSGYREATCAPTSHGRQAFTSSGTFTVPAGVRSINIHCTGGGSKGKYSSLNVSYLCGGGGGGGGYCSWENGISVSPGNQIICTVGAGGTANNQQSEETFAPSSSASLNGTMLVTAQGGSNGNWTTYFSGLRIGLNGGNKGGNGCTFLSKPNMIAATDGASSNSTKEFGTGTSYAGSGGGGGGSYYYSGASTTYRFKGGNGGTGGGGRGRGISTTNTGDGPGSFLEGAEGSAGTGGGGGGGATYSNITVEGLNGGSGNVIITW